MVAVSIVAYHTPDSELIRCIGSLSSDLICRITVVDNSRQASIRQLCSDLAVSMGKQIDYIPNENLGYGAAHNIAMRRSIEDGIDYHLVMNSDISFEAQAIDILCGRMDEDSRIGALQPRIVNPDGSDQFTVRRLPTPFDLILRRFMPEGWFKRRRDRYEMRDHDHSVEFVSPYHQGSFMLIRCEALKQVGLFDERFFMYPEDIDLTRRIHQLYATVYSPLATVVHDHRAASYRSGRMLRIHIINMVRYFNKWGWIFDGERRRINRSL